MSRRTVRATLVAILALAGALVLATSASAYRLSEDSTVPWPYEVITYHDSSAFPASVDRAARAWNRADVGYRFVEVDDPAEANLSIYTFDPEADDCAGSVVHGYNFAQGFMILDGRCDPYIMTLAATHEFGHVLTLLHDDDECAVMNSRSNANRSNPRLARPIRCRQGQQYWRSPVRSDDKRGGRAARRRPVSFPVATCYLSDGSFQSLITQQEHLCNYEYDCRGVDGAAPVNPALTVDPETGKATFLQQCERSPFDRDRASSSSAKRPSPSAAHAGHSHRIGESPGREIFGRARR